MKDTVKLGHSSQVLLMGASLTIGSIMTHWAPDTERDTWILAQGRIIEALRHYETHKQTWAFLSETVFGLWAYFECLPEYADFAGAIDSLADHFKQVQAGESVDLTTAQRTYMALLKFAPID